MTWNIYPKHLKPVSRAMSDTLKRIYDKISPERKRRFDYAEKIGNTIRILIENNDDLTKAKLAELANMKPSQVSRYLNGEANLTLETIAKLEIALNENLICIRNDVVPEGKERFGTKEEMKEPQ